ncbi:MAG: hypothetical protein K2V38_15135, partial [Gemmataceae bacterium]|nr:hypothetical protein [Gemmataceae bacterium]
PDTGERTHRLPGHDGRVVWADVTPDRRRLFVLAGVEGPARLHVWDLTVGRELLILPVPWDDPVLGPDDPRGVRFDGRRVLVPGSKGVRVFDGSPAGP